MLNNPIIKSELEIKRLKWLEERGTGIGGSDASAIIGENPYKTNVQLYREKVGLDIPTDIGNKPYVKYGKEAEPHLRELFILDYPEYEVIHEDAFKIERHPEYDFILGSLDGTLIEKTTGSKGVLEIKTTNILQSRQKEKWDARIPQNYYIQVLHYMLVTGANFAIIKAQLKSVWPNKDSGIPDIRLDTRHYYINREKVQSEIDYLLAEEIKFWNNHVVPRIEPPLKLPSI